MQGDGDSIPGWGAKVSPASWPKNQNRKQKQYCNKFNKDFKSGLHKTKTKKPELKVSIPSSHENNGLPRWRSGEESACQCRRCKRHRLNPWVGKIPLGRKWQPTPVFLPGKFHGQRSLAGYSSKGQKSWTRLNTHAHTQVTFQRV